MFSLTEERVADLISAVKALPDIGFVISLKQEMAGYNLLSSFKNVKLEAFIP